MTMLHEILAVEFDKEGYVKKTYEEIKALFKNKVERFQGFTRTFRLKNADDNSADLEKAEFESKRLETTVPEELDYLAKTVGDYLDVVYQKDLANAVAVADLRVGDKVLAQAVPATTLLGLESKLKQIKQVLDEIPTLQPGVSWERAPDIGKYVYLDAHPEVRAKTKKDFEFKVLVPPTEHHPAQVEKWTVDIDVGHYTKTKWSGCISVRAKSELLGRLDEMIRAAKEARQRANTQQVDTQASVGKTLFDHLLAGLRAAD